MDGMPATLGGIVLGVALAVAGTSPAQAAESAVAAPHATLQRVLVAVPESDAPFTPSELDALATRLHVADPAATAVVMLADETARPAGGFEVAIEPSPGGDATGDLVVRATDAALTVPLSMTRDTGAPAQATVVEVLGEATRIVAHRTGRLVLSPDELRLPEWRLPGDGTGAVALDGAWWSLGPSRLDLTTPDTRAPDGLRARLREHPVSAMERLVDVSVGDVTGDGVPDVALSLRRPYERTLLNAASPRRSWVDGDGLSAHVGLYRATDLSEIWVAGTLVRPVRRLAACTGALAVAYSTLRRSTILATSAWRWQGFAFLPLPDLPGRGTPACIDIDEDGRTEAAVIDRR